MDLQKKKCYSAISFKTNSALNPKKIHLRRRRIRIILEVIKLIFELVSTLLLLMEGCGVIHIGWFACVAPFLVSFAFGRVLLIVASLVQVSK